MKRVYVAPDLIDAEFVRSFLESAGIGAVVRGEHLFALRGLVPATDDTLPTVWVREDDDLARAEELRGMLAARSRLRSVADDEAEPAEADEEWPAAGEKLG
jgi:hypothetical protein